MRLRGAVKSPTFALSFAAHTRHALLPATNSCTPRWFGRRTARVLLADFCRAFGHSKAREKRSIFMYLAGEQCSPLQNKLQPAKSQNKRYMPCSCLGNAETGVYFIPLKSHPRRKWVLPLLPRLLPLPYRLLPPILFQPLRSLPLREPLPPLSFPPRHERV